MANNRMYIYCKECGKATTLAKRLGDGWYHHEQKDFNDFFNRHDNCGERDGRFALIEENNALVTQVGFRDEHGDLILNK